MADEDVPWMERRLASRGYVVISDERYEAIRSVTRRLLDGWRADTRARLWWRLALLTGEPMTEAEWQWLQQGDFG
jgi:hypothetical protein